MKLEPNLLIAPSRKAACIIFILFISVNFSFGSVLSKNCKGGPDCANCVERSHSHAPGTHADTQNYGCRPGDKNGTCGFETGRSPDEFNRIALTVRSHHLEFSGIIVAASDSNGQSNPSAEYLLHFDSPDIDETIPIYLLNDSLLC